MSINRFMILFLLVLITASAAFAQKETGAIEGTVVDNESRPIPGVTVTASSPSLIGGSQTAYTNESGLYRFPVLAPGVYEVKAELSGFQTVVRKDIVLSIITTLTVDFTLQLVQTSETIVVSSDIPPLIDVTTSAVSNTVPSRIVSNLPRQPNIESLVTLTPGVSDDLVAYGADSSDSSFWIDGVNLSNGWTRVSSEMFDSGRQLILQYDQNWIDQVQVVGIGAPAEYGSFTGVLANFVTKSGGNQFHGLFETFFQNEHMFSRNDHSASPQVPFTTYDISTQLGGPILKDKLWFFSGFQYPHTENPNNQYNILYIQSAGKMLNKLTYKWDNDNTLQGFLQFNNSRAEFIDHKNADLNTLNKTPTLSWNTSWISILNPNSSLEARIGGFNYDSKDIEDHPDVPYHYDNLTGLESGNNYGREKATEQQLHSSVSLSRHADQFLRGGHDFRFGVEFNRTTSEWRFDYNGGMKYCDNCPYGYNYGGPFYDFRSIFPTISGQGNSISVAAYAQDEWQITDRFTASIGGRWDHNRKDVAANASYSNDPVAPRLGFVWNLDQKSQTVLKANYGHYFVEVIPGNYSTTGSAPFINQIYRNGQWEELGRYYDTPPQVPPDLKQTFMRQFDVGVDRVLPGAIPLGVHYIYRRWEDLVGVQSLNPDSDFFQLTITNPVTGDPYTFNLFKPGVEDKGAVLTNPPWMSRRYHGLEVYANKQFGHGVALMASLMYSDLTGIDYESTRNFGGRPSPNFAHFRLPVDRPLSWKISGTAPLPWGFNAGWYYRHQSGDPWSATHIYVFFSPACGCDLSIHEPPGSRRLSDRNLVDLRLEKEFPLYKGQFRTTIDVFNLFNSDAPVGVEEDFQNPDFGKFRRVAPRSVRLGLRYTF